MVFSRTSFFFRFSRKSLAFLASSLSLGIDRDCERLELSPESRRLLLRFGSSSSSSSLDDSSPDWSSLLGLGFCYRSAKGQGILGDIAGRCRHACSSTTLGLRVDVRPLWGASSPPDSLDESISP